MNRMFPINVSKERIRMTGTKADEILSASLEIGALECAASSTRRTISEIVVSSPTLSARMTAYPDVTMVAEKTFCPTERKTGKDSPVMLAWLTDTDPSESVPSTGIESPCRMTTRSPTRTSEAGTVLSTPESSRIRAVFGVRSSSFLTASAVFFVALFSRYLPTLTKTRIMEADSKYRYI